MLFEVWQQILGKPINIGLLICIFLAGSLTFRSPLWISFGKILSQKRTFKFLLLFLYFINLLLYLQDSDVFLIGLISLRSVKWVSLGKLERVWFLFTQFHWGSMPLRILQVSWFRNLGFRAITTLNKAIICSFHHLFIWFIFFTFSSVQISLFFWASHGTFAWIPYRTIPHLKLSPQEFYLVLQRIDDLIVSTDMNSNFFRVSYSLPLDILGSTCILQCIDSLLVSNIWGIYTWYHYCLSVPTQRVFQ